LNRSFHWKKATGAPESAEASKDALADTSKQKEALEDGAYFIY